VDPYQQGADFEPKYHVCKTITIPGMSRKACNIFGLLWNVDFHRFLATISCFGEDSFFFSTSENLIEWNPAQELYNRFRDLPPEVAAMTPRSTTPHSWIQQHSPSMETQTFTPLAKIPTCSGPVSDTVRIEMVVTCGALQ
jgi:hypothetical protein